MAGILMSHSPSFSEINPLPEICLPEISKKSVGNENNSRSKSKKKRDKYSENRRGRKKQISRSRSCVTGPTDLARKNDRECQSSLSRIEGEGGSNFQKQSFRLPSILEERTDRFSFTCSAEIDNLFHDKLNIKENKAVENQNNNRKNGSFSADQIRSEENKKKSTKKVALLASIKPENQESEKEKFIKSRFTVNPVFEYKYNTNQAALERFSKPSNKLIHVAIKIMENALLQFGTYENFEDKTGGRRLTRMEIHEAAMEYLKKEDMEEEVVLRLSEDLVSRACMSRIKGQPTLQVRVDNIREHWMGGVLRHEIGTHYLRSYNNLKQPWGKSKRRKRFELRPLNPTEEGLASLHSVLFRKSPCLFRCALLYYTAYQASQKSFSELFVDIGRFLKDPETRWTYCLRAKRGQTETSKPGSFCKDQVYLKGAMEILKHRKDINFAHLIQCGKVDFRDVARIRSYADLNSTRVPGFMQDMNGYLAALDNIVVKNGLTESDFDHIS